MKVKHKQTNISSFQTFFLSNFKCFILQYKQLLIWQANEESLFCFNKIELKEKYAAIQSMDITTQISIKMLSNKRIIHHDKSNLILVNDCARIFASNTEINKYIYIYIWIYFECNGNNVKKLQTNENDFFFKLLLITFSR